jgi:hypothetical protein
MGIEPTSEAWEASILPLYDARSAPNFLSIYNAAKLVQQQGLPSSTTVLQVRPSAVSCFDNETRRAVWASVQIYGAAGARGFARGVEDFHHLHV